VVKKDAREDEDVCTEEDCSCAPNTEEDCLALELEVVRPKEPVQLSGDPDGNEACRLMPAHAAAGRNEREQGEEPAKVLRRDNLVESYEGERLRKDAQGQVSVEERADGGSGAELWRKSCKAPKNRAWARRLLYATCAAKVEVVKEQAEIVSRVDARNVKEVRFAHKFGAI
jgi:hypothetical protein